MMSSKDFLLAQVFFYKKKKCIEVRGMFDEGEGKGFYYRGGVNQSRSHVKVDNRSIEDKRKMPGLQIRR